MLAIAASVSASVVIARETPITFVRRLSREYNLRSIYFSSLKTKVARFTSSSGMWTFSWFATTRLIAIW